jgi:hypothetical protein
MNRLAALVPAEAHPRRINLRLRHSTQPLALPSLPRLTERLSLARPVSRTDMLRRATLALDGRR